MPDAPALVTVPNVELVKAGTWKTSTGVFTWSADDLAAAVEAQDDPAVPTPIVKLGHVDPRFDGEPAVGRVENLRLSEDRMTLMGDLTGVPGWLAGVMGSAYPSRSIEGWFGWSGATGVHHDFVLTALALLGVMAPAVEGLEDIKALYDVDQVAAARHPASGTPVTVTFEERTVPQPVTASVNIDDVRTEFYETQPPGSWAWVREVWSDFIIVDNDEGDLYRIPWTEDPPGDVTFGTPERVVVEYMAAPADDDSESNLALAARYVPGAGLQSPATNLCAARRRAPSLRGPRRTLAGRGQEGDTMLTPEQRSALGLAEDATPEQITEALLAAGAYAAAERDALAAQLAAGTEATPITAELPEGVVAIESAVLEDMRSQIAAASGVTARYQTEERGRVLAGALGEGKVHPSRKAYWQGELERDFEGTSKILAALEKGSAVPLAEVGTAAGTEGLNDDDVFFARVAPGFVAQEKARA